MREIKFRGKTTNLEENIFVYGYYVKCLWHGLGIEGQEYHEIHLENGMTHYIDPGTLGQYTGIKDKDGIEIYEGDIVNSWAGHNEVYIRKVVMAEDRLELLFEPLTGYSLCKGNEELFEVIGNIHDNPEPLEEE